MSCIKLCMFITTLVLFTCTVNGKNFSIVTLSHGGQVRGLRTSFQDVLVNSFLGIPYAQPPIGRLRFQKPRKASPWTGVVDALEYGSVCLQTSVTGNPYDGDEDCLFLDLTVPVTTSGSGKAVMVYFHGGGFQTGSGSEYIGGPLAVTGDVIVVTLNYRLGVLGFLSDGPGTGNFGLWDQRAALRWIQENIEYFGGDPNLVTIFGQSAGGSSVSAHMMSHHSTGLFKRAIQQSSSIYSPIFWTTSFTRARYETELMSALKTKGNCSNERGDIYTCIRLLSTEELVKAPALHNVMLLDRPENPTPDGDFFVPEVENNTYTASRRFDLLLGFNNQEGLIMLNLDAEIFAAQQGVSLEDGIPAEFLDKYLSEKCRVWFTVYSIELCIKFIKNTYGFNDIVDDKERAVRLVDFLGEHVFNCDAVREAEQHSNSGSTSTYAYYYTEPTQDGNRLWPKPSWLPSKGDHFSEIKYVFGSPLLANDTTSIWHEQIEKSFSAKIMYASALESEKNLSLSMMLMWSNFAKSGNPNSPVSLPDGIPVWPQFTAENNQFLEINSKQMKVITTPNKNRLEMLADVLWKDRDAQLHLEKFTRNT